MSYNPLEPRRFGIELELSRRLTSVAYETKSPTNEWTAIQHAVRNQQNAGQISPGWKVKTDSSCGGEIVSPILFGAKGLTETTLITSVVRDIAKKAGKFSADGECGLHIHFDAAELTAQQLSRMLVILHKYEPIIYGMYPHRNMKYCAPISLNMKLASRFRDWVDVRDVWYRGSNNVREPGQFYEDRFINGTSAGEPYDGTRYHGFNIHCYWRQQTVEFRYGPGTFNPIEIAAYYELCLSIVNAAIHGSIKPTNDIIGYKFKDLNALYMSRSKFRSYVSDFFDLLRLTRQTRKYILDRLRITHSSMMRKAWDRKYGGNIRVITADDAGNYLFRNMENGKVYFSYGGECTARPYDVTIIDVRRVGSTWCSNNPKFLLEFKLNIPTITPIPFTMATGPGAPTPIEVAIN